MFHFTKLYKVADLYLNPPMLEIHSPVSKIPCKALALKIYHKKL